ncbi:MAG: transporter [Rhodoferax sp.]|nr:transporter [Rhodoferax sp.]
MGTRHMSTNPLFQAEGIAFAYPGEPALLHGFDCTVGAGVTQLHGDTGSGKSTLLKIFAGVLRGTGSLTLCGTRLDIDPAAYRRQVFHVDPATEAYDQVSGRACTDTLMTGDPGFDRAAWQALVSDFNLDEHIDKPMYMLSTGSKRKVWLAAALASPRPLVLLDEPTGGLDGPSVRALWRRLGELAEQGQQAVVVARSERIAQVPLAGLLTLPGGAS